MGIDTTMGGSNRGFQVTLWTVVLLAVIAPWHPASKVLFPDGPECNYL